MHLLCATTFHHEHFWDNRKYYFEIRNSGNSCFFIVVSWFVNLLNVLCIIWPVLFFISKIIWPVLFSYFFLSVTVGNVPNLLAGFFARLEAIVKCFTFTDFIFDYTWKNINHYMLLHSIETPDPSKNPSI